MLPGPTELIVLLAIALIILGPKRLPEVARSIGKAVNEFKRSSQELTESVKVSLDEEERKPLK
ncbi:MAG: Sec-independent protein translocase subunit TatA/TatB [Candidatus Aquicultorales bacterium]